MRDFPKFGIKPSPDLVGGMIPGPAQVQSQLGQGIERLDPGTWKASYLVLEIRLFSHGGRLERERFPLVMPLFPRCACGLLSEVPFDVPRLLPNWLRLVRGPLGFGLEVLAREPHEVSLRATKRVSGVRTVAVETGLLA
jgi:hypothetical protein